MPAATAKNADEQSHTDASSHRTNGGYSRFGLMILASTIVMWLLMYVNTYAFDHIEFSETRAYMALLMGASMAIVMLSFMLAMHNNKKINTAIFITSTLVLAGATYLVRSQSTVQDVSYMNAMIPHHSIAILTSENSEISDPRVCELAVSIIEAQRREIAEMHWLVEDIKRNGTAQTAAEAAQRPVPDFQGSSLRSCSTDS